MTSTQARKLTLGAEVNIVGVTYELKLGQRHGTVVGLQERQIHDPLVTVKIPDGREMTLDCHWIQTHETLVDLFNRLWDLDGAVTAIELELSVFVFREFHL